MPLIFISYRRDDCAGHAGRLYDRLRDHFGPENIFRDIDTIEPGQDFVDAIETAVGACPAVVVLIGKQWANIKDAEGRRRLDNPEDFVRLEVAAALKRKVRVVPVLLQGAAMPASTDLPEPLAKLARLNAIEVSDTRWDYDVGRLIDALNKALGHAPGTGTPAAIAPVSSAPAARGPGDGGPPPGTSTARGTGDGGPPAVQVTFHGTGDGRTRFVPGSPPRSVAAPPILGHPWQVPPAQLTAADFVGRWRFEDSAVIKSFIDAEFHADGTCQGAQTAAALGFTINFSGQWSYLPAAQLLQVQGLIGGFQPFSFAVMIQASTPSGLQGLGQDGLVYSLQRA